MARRRSPQPSPIGMDDREAADFGDLMTDDGGMSDLINALPESPDPGADMYFDPEINDWRYNLPVPPKSDAIAGTEESAREIFGQQAPTTPLRRVSEQPPTPQGMQLPRGVSVPGGADSGVMFPGTGATATGLQPWGPSESAPTASVPPSPMAPQLNQAQSPRRAPLSNPMSVSSAPSALFPETGIAGLLGSAGGLTGGGRGVIGRSGGTEGTPSDLLLSILNLLQQRG